MPKHRVPKKHLRKKGWSEEELQDAEVRLGRANQNITFADQFVFWFLLLVGIAGVIVFCLYAVPLLLLLPALWLYPTLIILGLAFGALFITPLRDLHWLSKKHHALPGVILPVTALASVVLLVKFADRFELPGIFSQNHNPWVIGIVFAVCLLIPCFVGVYRKQ